MHRETHGPRGGYRSPAPSSEPRFTVITVRPDEYARPVWLERLRALWTQWMGAPAKT